MNKLSFLSSIPSNKDTYIYVLPTNSQKSLNLDAVSIKVHILDLRGNSLLVFPAAGASSDGVCFTLSNLANLGSGTYAIYLELLYAHHQEFYPNDSVKYLTIKNDDKGNLVFTNMFTAESSSIVPPQDTKSDLTDVLHVHDIDLKSITTNTLASGRQANVYLDQNDNLIFQIPVGPKGDKGDTGATGKSAYQVWLDAGNKGTEADYLKSLKGDKGDKGDQGIQGERGQTGATGPQGRAGFSVWMSKYARGGNLNDQYGSDLYNTSTTNRPQVNDLIIESDGSVVIVTAIKDSTHDSTTGFVFSNGPVVASFKGPKGDTPVRGTDYWTDADQQAIKDDVTKTVGDAFAKAKTDVEDAILNGKW